MREKVLRRRIPANQRANTNDHGTPRSSAVRRRFKPAADRKFLEPSKDLSILKRSKSEPSLLKGVGGSTETEALEKVAPEEDEGVLCRPVTWVDIFTSPEIWTPRKCYQKDAKVVVNVTVEGSAGPIQTLVKLGSNVEETINLVIRKYNEQGRIPHLDEHSASTCQLHRSYFSLHSLSKWDLIGDIGCRSFYLRKCSSDQRNANREEDISNSSYLVDVKVNSSANQSTISFTSLFFCHNMEKIILRTRRFCNFFGCIPCIG